MANCELRQPLLLQDEESFDERCYINQSHEDSSSGYDSTDCSDTEVDAIQTNSREYRAPPTAHVSARVKSTHALCESLKLIMEFPEMCDVTFLVGRREIPVHSVRAILGLRSKVMYQLIIKHLNLRENDGKCTRSRGFGDRLVIPVRKYDAEVFRMLIQFVHSGTAAISDSTVFGLPDSELELFNPELLKKPAVLALNKLDTDEGGKNTDAIVDQIQRLPDSLSEVEEELRPKTLIKFDEIYKISTMFDLNTLTMKKRMRKLLDVYTDIQDEKEFQESQNKSKNQQLSTYENVLGREHNRNKML